MPANFKPALPAMAATIAFVFLTAGFFFLPGSTLQSTTKLKKLHKTVQLRCKNCHHKPKKGAPLDVEPTPGNKKCYQCHRCGTKKLGQMSALPDILKSLHKYCASCHREYQAVKGRDNLKKHLKATSRCLVCHK